MYSRLIQPEPLNVPSLRIVPISGFWPGSTELKLPRKFFSKKRPKSKSVATSKENQQTGMKMRFMVGERRKKKKTLDRLQNRMGWKNQSIMADSEEEMRDAEREENAFEEKST